jgi:hypothetical protein
VLEQITATRYVTPLKEGGSLPGIIEADDLGTYVLKFRGAGQGLKVLVAEVLVGELARALGLDVPRLTVVDLQSPIAKYEADEEVQDLLTASLGLNLGIDFLPGSFGYDGSRPPTPQVAAEVLWLDALTANVDRTWSNPNLLVWHRRPWLIDHGAALYFHYSWEHYRTRARDPYPQVARHVLLPYATALPEADAVATARLTPEVLRAVVDLIPDDWLDEPTFPTPEAHREAYLAYLTDRLTAPRAFLETAVAAAADARNADV